ncbi:hypothetical protein [Algibacter mikhailovii]|uniref:Uncharacterized protein n=1 Tax=Algibacter mikhailovii TaxID=425498 RepID=A0A918QY68_9FLAO|nr:hypothetical protein [Algibacter mikhailovii]GGZ72526.1 hypothetical protein GCM10007028_06940 [Algibacter mikhailovii]
MFENFILSIDVIEALEIKYENNLDSQESYYKNYNNSGLSTHSFGWSFGICGGDESDD